jgi:hypothetical protein
MREEDSAIHGTAISRKAVVELIILAVLLSFGVNIVSGQLLNSLTKNSLLVFFIGMCLCIIPIVYALIEFFRKRKKRISIETFFTYNPLKVELVPVSRYKFSEELSDFFKAAFAENPAIKTQWEKQPLEPYGFILKKPDGSERKLDRNELSQLRISIDGTRDALLPPDGDLSISFYPVSAEDNATAKLIIEAMEYYLLERLSGHLKGYFLREDVNEKHLKEYTRNDIPAILLSNTFLELFSRPMIQRSAFADHVLEEKETETYKARSVARDGPMYNDFQLILPKGSKITRPKNHEIEINTKKLKIRLTPRFHGQLAAVSHAFRCNYMGYTNLFDIAAYSAYIDVSISIKMGAMFSVTGWSYYRWVDSFLSELENAASTESFFQRINWETTLTLLECLNNVQKPGRVKQKRKGTSTEPVSIKTSDPAKELPSA